jgi:hypothetical protein
MNNQPQETENSMRYFFIYCIIYIVIAYRLGNLTLSFKFQHRDETAIIHAVGVTVIYVRERVHTHINVYEYINFKYILFVINVI